MEKRRTCRQPNRAISANVRVCVSVAVSIDGFIDDRSGERLVLSSPEDLADMREEREKCDAILVGAGTIRRDNPALRSSNAMRVTMTESGDLDPSARFFDGSVRTLVLASRARSSDLQTRLHDRATIVAVDAFDPASIVTALESHGVHSLFVEGGTRVLTAFLSSGTFDRLRLAVAPFFVGDEHAPRLVNAGVFLNDKNHRLMLHGVRMLGDVAVLDYYRSQS
jgi:5-amino-6-(5-phosphoribosylamino)uracil reductase